MRLTQRDAWKSSESFKVFFFSVNQTQNTNGNVTVGGDAAKTHNLKEGCRGDAGIPEVLTAVE